MLRHEVSWKRPWYVFQLQDGFHGAPGRPHDRHQALVGVLFNCHIWKFNFLTHYASIHHSPSVSYRLWKTTCSLFNIYNQALVHTVGSPEELHGSQPLGVRGESPHSFPVEIQRGMNDWIWTLPSQGGWLNNLSAKPASWALKRSL